MKSVLTPQLEIARVQTGFMASAAGSGPIGLFRIMGPCGKSLQIISSGPYGGWEHVSVSIEKRCPSWAEMCFVKELFWDNDEAVMQLHPAKSNYVNVHKFCLHLWRPVHATLPLPPSVMV